MKKHPLAFYIPVIILLSCALVSCNFEKIEFKEGQKYSIDPVIDHSLSKSDSILIQSIGIDSFNKMKQEVDSLGHNDLSNPNKIGPRINDSSTKAPNE